MDARERFQKIVVPNYNEFVRNPTDFRTLDNLFSSMNPMAEYIALDQREYSGISRNERRREAQALRVESGLTDAQKCAEIIKHVRIEVEQDGVKSTLSSTGIDTSDPTTWKVGGLDFVQVAHATFAALNEKLNKPSK